MREIDKIRLFEDSTASLASSFGVTGRSQHNASPPTSAEMELVQDAAEDLHHRRRSRLAGMVVRDGQPRYAIKKLSKATERKAISFVERNRDQFIASVVDLAMEVEFLKVFDDHPNIIRLRGLSSSHPCSSGFFIIFDCLSQTFIERFSSWKRSARKLSGLPGLFIDTKGIKKTLFFFDRLSTLYGICSALRFIHSKR